jgi:hypothetical protein
MESIKCVKCKIIRGFSIKSLNMKKYSILLIGVTLLFFNQAYAKKMSVLAEVGSPQDMVVDNGQLIITDRTDKVHAYSLKDFKYQGLISRRGEGPGEIRITPFLTVSPGYIFLYSLGKGIFFSRDGKLIREFRIPQVGTHSVAPLGEDFVCKKWEKNKRNGGNYYDLSIYSYTGEEKLKFKKMLYYFDAPPRKRSGGKWDYDVVKEYNDYIIYDNKVFVGDSTKGLFIAVFDNQGNEINQIKLDTEKIKVTDQYKNKLSNMIKKDPLWRSHGEGMYNLVFPEYFPAFYRFSVDNGKVYFLTYKLKDDNQREVIITDLKGNLLKRSHVPWIENELRIDYSIENDKFYYIIVNEETEDWEIHVEEIR